MEGTLLVVGMVALAILWVLWVLLPFFVLGVQRRLDTLIAEQRETNALLRGRAPAAGPPPAPPADRGSDAPLAPDEVDDLGGFKAER